MNQDSPLRWTIEKAGREFNFDPKTVKKRMVAVGESPGDDGFYSTDQLVLGLFGGLHWERVRKTREEADNVALANAKLRGELIEIDRFLRDYQGILAGMIQVIASSKLTEDEQNEMRTQLAKLHDIGQRPPETDDQSHEERSLGVHAEAETDGS